MAYLSRMRRIWLLCLAAAVACAVPACSPGSSPAPGPARHGHNTAPRVHVSGNRLVNSHGRPVVLHGVTRPRTEVLCVKGPASVAGPRGQVVEAIPLALIGKTT
jgi:hypothetical protein